MRRQENVSCPPPPGSPCRPRFSVDRQAHPFFCPVAMSDEMPDAPPRPLTHARLHLPVPQGRMKALEVLPVGTACVGTENRMPRHSSQPERACGMRKFVAAQWKGGCVTADMSGKEGQACGVETSRQVSPGDVLRQEMGNGAGPR